MMDYNQKPATYYGHERREIIDEVPLGSGAVLEVGCAEGRTGAALKREGRATWVAGIELMDVAAEQARLVLDEVVSGSIEQVVLPYDAGQFDVIILADVLEHLVDPWAALERLKVYLKPNGLVIVSLPNVRNWRVMIPLFFRGKWEYQNSGILDRTHLRFFTRLSMIDLLAKSNLGIRKVKPIGRHSAAFHQLGFGFFSELKAVQYVLVGTKNCGVD